MTSEELTAAIKYLKPNAEFSFTDNDYSTIKWNILEGEAPTLKEIESAINKIKKEELAKAEAKATARAAILDRLGLTAEEAAILLG